MKKSIFLMLCGVMLVAATILVLIAMAACKGTPTTPTTTTVTSSSTTTTTIPDCQKNNTGTLRVENRSSRSLDYNVIIDNINYGRLKVGAYQDFTCLVGMHSLAFYYADHNGIACSGTASIFQCQMTWLYCDQ